VRVFCGDEILSAEASKALGVVGRGTLFELTEAILAQDPGRALEVLELALSGGLDISLFLQEFVVHWRELLLASFGGEGMLSRIGVSQELQSDMTRLVQNLAAPDLQDLVFIARTGADEALRSSYPKYALEALIVRMATREPVSDLGSILRKVRTTLDSSANASSSSSAPRAASMKTSREPPVSASSFPKTRGKASESAPSLARSQTKTLPSIGSKGASQEAPKKENRILQWGEFVRASFSSCGVVLGEHLKRLCVTRFEAGLLEAEGPKFSITSLEEESLRKKLLEALEDFCPLGTPAGTSSTGATWVLRLRPLEQGIGAAQGSLEHRSKEEAKEKARERRKKIVSHPSVQTIKKICPGSTIEKVRLEGTS
jgi:hypothetical protein